MAKKIIKEKAIEEALWESANKLRGSVVVSLCMSNRRCQASLLYSGAALPLGN